MSSNNLITKRKKNNPKTNRATVSWATDMTIMHLTTALRDLKLKRYREAEGRIGLAAMYCKSAAEMSERKCIKIKKNSMYGVMLKKDDVIRYPSIPNVRAYEGITPCLDKTK